MRILFVGFFQDKINCSTGMFAYGINNALKKLDIELITLNMSNYGDCELFTITKPLELEEKIKEIGEVDFTICHLLENNTTNILYSQLKNITKFLVTIFIEVAILNWKYDWYYLYFDKKYYKEKKYTVYNAPILKEFYQPVPKEKNSILLDHRWQRYMNTDYEKTDEIIEWLRELSDTYHIYKLGRWDDKQNNPDFITEIPQCSFENYIKLISDKEIFISTHMGSYNSTAIDMLALGAKCIIPKLNDDFTFIPLYNISLFNLPTFSTKEELLSEIKKPLNHDILLKQIDKCSDINKIVKDIHTHFSKIKNEYGFKNNIIC